ncbi:TldD/PmbA family protein [Cochlodiniinecator piscidefendens]|uniref:TldD/PmbA family protein n=1 Tax=Cochlodiniinecator piscidefendens TaxID=2715756 RepID=UPI00140A6EF5|nr:TldD/PmbA family protein [Cochlodiniinecator piscidefendens]
MTNSLDSLTSQLLEAAKRAGADAADALAVEGQSTSIEVLNGALEHAERSEGTDIGLRVMVGTRQAIVSASDTRPETIAIMAERAVAMAKEAPEDPYVGLADANEIAASWDIDALELFDPSDAPTPEMLQQDALRAEAAAMENSEVSQVQSAGANYGTHGIHLAATNGFSGGYQRSSRSVSCVAISGTGSEMERDYYGDGRVFQSDLISAEEIGQIAATRAVERRNARKPKTGSYPVLFDERVSSSLVGHILGAINGAAIARGGSWLRDAMGEQILPSHLSLIENPHRPRIGGSRPFDGEGLPTQSRTIIEDGILQTWILDLASARKLNLTSTANAARGTSSAPSPSATNVALTQGTQSQRDLIKDMGTGLLVTSMIGTSINPTTGDYSRGATGFWIENGEVQYPVNECTIAGNLRDMLRTISPANDARLHLSRVVPSILVEGLTLAGE